MNKYQEAFKYFVSSLHESEHESEDIKALRELCEKATPKKPSYEGDGYSDGHIVLDTWICPCCGKDYEVDYEEYDYCPNCGQAIDWSQEVR